MKYLQKIGKLESSPTGKITRIQWEFHHRSICISIARCNYVLEDAQRTAPSTSAAIALQLDHMRLKRPLLSLHYEVKFPAYAASNPRAQYD